MTITRRKLLASIGGLAATVGLSAIWASRMTNYDGPVSDHFDGKLFFDPDGTPPKSLGEVLRWQFGGGRKRAVWPDWVENEFADTPPNCQRSTSPNDLGGTPSGSKKILPSK